MNSMEQSHSWEAYRSSTSQDIPSILWNLKVHYRIHQYLPPVPVLNQINAVHDSPSPFLKIHFNIIISYSFSMACIVSSPRPYEVFHNTGGVYTEEQLAPCPRHRCRLSGAAYSIYLQLPSIPPSWACTMPFWLGPTYHRPHICVCYIVVRLWRVLCSDCDVICIFWFVLWII
jgi:hypothetical protein